MFDFLNQNPKAINDGSVLKRDSLKIFFDKSLMYYMSNNVKLVDVVYFSLIGIHDYHQVQKKKEKKKK